jgi:tripartite-type tricarboxylate transporter receptor subunit TctC
MMMQARGRLHAMVAFGAVLGVLAAATDDAVAQPYPSRPIKLVSPFSAGSPPDLLARLAGQQISQRLAQSVAVENRPGGGATIATKAVAAADPDGYTLLLASSALLYGALLHPQAGYDPIKNFAPVATLARWSHILVIPPDIPVSNVAEFVAYAKARPGALGIGFPLGTTPQVLSELFKSASGAPLNSIPYRQMTQLRSDLLGGRIHAYFGAGAALISLIEQGKLKPLIYTGEARHPALPQVPTAIESGMPSLTLSPSDWVGILAPAGTPPAVIDTLNGVINAGLNSPELQANLRHEGDEAQITSPREFATFLAAEAVKWPRLMKATGMAPH